MYQKRLKRPLDAVLSFTMLIVLLPLLLLLTLTGAIAMGGNPFFIQARPGYHGRIFRLIKFRTMSDERDAEGELLRDDLRLNAYGRFLRSSSLDELPELINVLKGDMSLVGPRPLLVKYLSLYSPLQRHRHDVRPGMTGLAQVNGRNKVNWEERFAMDVRYTQHVTFREDMRILFCTVKTVLTREGITPDASNGTGEFKGNIQQEAENSQYEKTEIIKQKN